MLSTIHPHTRWMVNTICSASLFRHFSREIWFSKVINLCDEKAELILSQSSFLFEVCFNPLNSLLRFLIPQLTLWWCNVILWSADVYRRFQISICYVIVNALHLSIHARDDGRDSYQFGHDKSTSAWNARQRLKIHSNIEKKLGGREAARCNWQ